MKQTLTTLTSLRSWFLNSVMGLLEKFWLTRYKTMSNEGHAAGLWRPGMDIREGQIKGGWRFVLKINIVSKVYLNILIVNYWYIKIRKNCGKLQTFYPFTPFFGNFLLRPAYDLIWRSRMAVGFRSALSATFIFFWPCHKSRSLCHKSRFYVLN